MCVTVAKTPLAGDAATDVHDPEPSPWLAAIAMPGKCRFHPPS